MKIFVPSQNKTASVELIGGKAYNLFKLNMPNTPRWICLTDDFFKAHDEKDFLTLTSLLDSRKKYAVRSSGIDEDGAAHSFAGIHESFLNVEIADLRQCLDACYSSAFTERAAEYRKSFGISTDNIRMAVIVQEMVESDYAGVINTINPVTDNPDETVISVVKGLGEGLVSGEKNSTDYYVSGSKIRKNGDITLGDKVLKRLISMTELVKSKSSAFQDIEFAIKDNKVYFLQSRDIVPYKDVDLTLPRKTLDNSNIVESFCGVTTPLTFSFAHEIYTKVYTQTLKVGKISPKVTEALSPYLSEMISFYENKIYYNLNSWYALVSVFPSKHATSYMESMMGVGCKLTDTKIPNISFSALLNVGRIFLGKLSSIEKDSEEFINKFNSVVMPKVGLDFSGYTGAELIEYYETLERDILDGFTTPIINDCGAMFYMGMLKKAVAKNGISDVDGYVASLVSRQGNVESAYSAPLFMKIVEKICADPDIKDDFLTFSPDRLKGKYLKNSKISQAIEDYIKVFGPRVMDELKLETVTLIEDCEYLFSILKCFICDSATPKERTNEIRANISLIKKGKAHFCKTLEKTKYFIRNRERLRLKRTYIFSVIRNIFLAFGREFAKCGIINEPRDVFFLTKDEIFDISKTGKTPPLFDTVSQRKAEYRENAKKVTYSRIVFYGDKKLCVKPQCPPGNDGKLCGIPSGAGVVRGNVKLVKTPENAVVNDKIILTYRTDPGWVILFPLCRGLIVERGSIMSHSAVVAREMGIPAVVGVPDATKLINDGDTVTLDGIKGEITVEK